MLSADQVKFAEKVSLELELVLMFATLLSAHPTQFVWLTITKDSANVTLDTAVLLTAE